MNTYIHKPNNKPRNDPDEWANGILFAQVLVVTDNNPLFTWHQSLGKNQTFQKSRK